MHVYGGKIPILTSNDFGDVNAIINKPNKPRCDIKCVKTALILGRVVSTENDHIEDFTERIITSRVAWAGIKHDFVTK